MPRSAGQSDFVIRAEPEVFEVELPREADPVRLPRAVWRTHLASERATRVVMWFVGVTLALLLVLTLVGPHIPSGE